MSKITKELFEESLDFGKKILAGLGSSVSPFHSAETLIALVEKAGFTYLNEQ